MAKKSVTTGNKRKSTAKEAPAQKGTAKVAHISSKPSGRKKQQNHNSKEAAQTRSPSQRRSKETVKIILTAAEELFVQLGFAGTTTNKIAVRAGVSIGSLYQYFPDKTAILMTLFKSQIVAGLPRIESAIKNLETPGVPLKKGLLCLVEEVVAMHEMSPRLRDILLTEARRMPKMRALLKGAQHRYVTITADVLRRLPNIRDGEFALMATILVESVEAHAHWIANNGATGVQRNAAILEVVELLSGYINKR